MTPLDHPTRILVGGTLAKAARKTCNTGARIFEDQHDYINKYYPGNTSMLIRFLIDEYTDNPELRTKFEKHLATQASLVAQLRALR